MYVEQWHYMYINTIHGINIYIINVIYIMFSWKRKIKNVRAHSKKVFYKYESKNIFTLVIKLMFIINVYH